MGEEKGRGVGLRPSAPAHADSESTRGSQTRGRTGRWTLTGAGGPGPSASPPLLSLEEPGLRRGPGEATGPTPQSPVGLGLCTG